MRFKNSVIYRWAAVNLVGFILLGAAISQGWVGAILAADVTMTTWIIAAVLGMGLALSAWRSWQLNGAYNIIMENPYRYVDAIIILKWSVGRSALPHWGAVHVNIFREIAATLFVIGLAGTVLGLIIALGSVNPQAAADTATAVPMIAGVLHGVSVKLYATLCGILSSIWITVNYQILAGQTQRFIAEILPLAGDDQ